MEIKIEDYLTELEIKEIIVSQLKNEVSTFFKDEKNAQRLLSNLSYQIVFDEVDKIIPDSRDKIIKNTKDVIQKSSNYNVFRGREYGGTPSLAYTIMEEAVKQNKDLLNQKIKETIESRDYSEEIWSKFEELGENFMSNIYAIVELGRTKKNNPKQSN